MSNNILFVFEGSKTEEQIIVSLQKYLVKEKTSIKCIYGAEIYQLYKEIEADNDLDTFNLLKERNAGNGKILERYTRQDFAEIYLFFDYEGHSSLANDDRLSELLDFFKEETDKGKLYISYPMVESLKHICDYSSFHELTVDCKSNIHYKKMVAENSLKELINFNGYDLGIWKSLIAVHLKKMNFLFRDLFELPAELIAQQAIFSKQLEKHIIPYARVAVLSAFPVFLYDYYGDQKTKEIIALDKPALK